MQQIHNFHLIWQFCGGNISLQQRSFHAKQFIATELDWTCQVEQSQVSPSDEIRLPWIMLYYSLLPVTHPVLAPPSLPLLWPNFVKSALLLMYDKQNWNFLDNIDEVLSNHIFSTLQSVFTTFKWKHLNTKNFCVTKKVKKWTLGLQLVQYRIEVYKTLISMIILHCSNIMKANMCINGGLTVLGLTVSFLHQIMDT